jgi:hypothetical protein
MKISVVCIIATIVGLTAATPLPQHSWWDQGTDYFNRLMGNSKYNQVESQGPAPIAREGAADSVHATGANVNASVTAPTEIGSNATELALNGTTPITNSTDAAVEAPVTNRKTLDDLTKIHT